MLGVDDTLARKRGPKIFGVGMHHDPLRSTRSRPVTRWGLSYVSLGVIVRFPFRPDHSFYLPPADAGHSPSVASGDARRPLSSGHARYLWEVPKGSRGRMHRQGLRSTAAAAPHRGNRGHRPRRRGVLLGLHRRDGQARDRTACIPVEHRGRLPRREAEPRARAAARLVPKDGRADSADGDARRSVEDIAPKPTTVPEIDHHGGVLPRLSNRKVATRIMTAPSAHAGDFFTLYGERPRATTPSMK